MPSSPSDLYGDFIPDFCAGLGLVPAGFRGVLSTVRYGGRYKT
jgi:hypothetical protein